MKKLWLSLILILFFTGGCVPLVIGATVGGAYLKYKGLANEANALHEVVKELKILNEELEKEALNK